MQHSWGGAQVVSTRAERISGESTDHEEEVIEGCKRMEKSESRGLQSSQRQTEQCKCRH